MLLITNMHLHVHVHVITRFSIYHRVPFRYTRQTRQRQEDIVTVTQEAEHRIVRGHHMHEYNIFGLPALLSGFIFVPIGPMCTIRIILRCFGDKICEIVGHTPRINRSAMIAIFV